MGKRFSILFMALFLVACSNGDGENEEEPNDTANLPETNPQVQLSINGEPFDESMMEVVCWQNCTNEMTSATDYEQVLEQMKPILANGSDTVSFEVVGEELPESVDVLHFVGYRTDSNILSPGEIEDTEYVIEDPYSFNPFTEAVHTVQTNFIDEEDQLVGSIVQHFIIEPEEE